MSSHPETAASAPPPPEAPLVGRRVGKYEIVRSIGRGGMGMVYEALNTTIGKRVAMKFVEADLAQNKDAVARFHREAQAASAVESAHIVEIFDSGFTDDEVPYIVMELLRGEDLGHRIKRCGRLELAEALHVTAQILRGLHRAHEAGIVHRDLKPDNVFLVDRDDDPNFAKIVDFGISKVQRGGDVPAHTLTRQGTVLGTPFYMSPEQAQAMSDVDGRTDLWSVGAILYECLTGRPPHSGNSYEQVIVNICMKDVDDVRLHNPSVPEPIARVIAKALARDRAHRFGSARELLDALVASAGGLLKDRGGRGSRDDAAHASSPGSPGRTPIAITPPANGEPAQGHGPTLEVQGGGSKVGWSTSSGTAVRRPQRRALFAVAAASLAAGVASAILYARTPADGEQAAQAGAEVTMTLRANAPGARFLVDGVALEGGVLRGPGGERKRVRVEADGFTPMDKEVILQAGGGPVDVTLDPLPPTVTPAPAGTAEPAPTATPTAAPATSSAAAKGPKGGVRPTSKTAQPGPTAAPVTTGVAGGLQLKTD